MVLASVSLAEQGSIPIDDTTLAVAQAMQEASAAIEVGGAVVSLDKLLAGVVHTRQRISA